MAARRRGADDYNVSGMPASDESAYGAAPAQTAPSAAPQTPSIEDAYQTYLGRQARPDEVQGWAGNPDYFEGIKNSPEAWNYGNARAQERQPGLGGLMNGFGGGDWTRPNRQMIQAYGQSRGYAMNEQEADWWVQQWPKLMQDSPNDPTYATMRLSKADQWTDPSQRYMAGASGFRGGEFNDPWGGKLEQLVGQFLGDTKKRGEDLATTYRARAGELRQPAYSNQEDAAMQAKAFDQLERRRQETLKNRRESVYLRGFAPTSGIVQGEERNVNTAFEQARTGISSDMLRSQLEENEARRNAATQLEALATEALNGGDLGAIQATGLPLQLMAGRQSAAQRTFDSSNQSAQLLSLLMSGAMGQQGYNQTRSSNNMAGLGSILQLLFGGLT